ncbi:MAG: hypothetical protein V9G12_01820 [Microthrixaceae bacterium]
MGTVRREREGRRHDVIKAQDQHLKDAVAGGDEAHGPACNDMKARWRRPVSGLKWYKQVRNSPSSLRTERGRCARGRTLLSTASERTRLCARGVAR